MSNRHLSDSLVAFTVLVEVTFVSSAAGLTTVWFIFSQRANEIAARSNAILGTNDQADPLVVALYLIGTAAVTMWILSGAVAVGAWWSWRKAREHSPAEEPKK